MHPDLLGALARQHQAVLSDRFEFRDSGPGRPRRPTGRRPLARARWHLGATLLDVGLHLMSASAVPTRGSGA